MANRASAGTVSRVPLSRSSSTSASSVPVPAPSTTATRVRTPMLAVLAISVRR